uniref:RNA-directed DNA polymerase from mobile element jockey n=1 Tax=Bactrocera latifrons TaxID=174628 RepID=A0A0K8VMK1_BACLA
MAKEAKRLCFQKFTANINPVSSPKKIWNEINLLTGGTKNSYTPRINTPVELLIMSEQISNFFANRFSAASSDEHFTFEFRNSKVSIPDSFTDTTYDLSSTAKMLESRISLSEFKYALSSVKGKTPGLDNISYPMIENLPISIKIRLVELYNNIFDTAVYPQYWKTSNIIPILKPGKLSTDVNNYRPISLLSCLGKVFEKIIGTRLAWFARRNNLISPRQIAYKKGHGTIDTLLLFDNFVTTALSSKNHVSLLSLDFEKAFDRIGMHVILKQLQKWKVGPKILNFIKSFLTNRKLSVTVNGFLSPTRNLSNGTPQGSPLSALLFVIAFDELSNLLSKHKKIEHQMYGDDVLIFSKVNDISAVQNIFKDVLNDIATWSTTSGVLLSLEKTNLLHICRKRTPCNIILNVEKHKINTKDSLKILGLIVGSKYSFKQHCNFIRSSLISRSNIIKYLSCKHSYIHPATLINVVRAVLLSKVNNALPIYGHCAKSTISRILAPYHAAIRRSLKAFPTSPTKFLLTASGLPSISNRVSDTTNRVLGKLLDATNTALTNAFNNAISRKRQLRIPSALSRSLVFVKENFISLYREKRVVETFPPWLISPTSFEDSLLNLPRQHTPNAVYRASFSEAVDTYSATGWNFIFTDGSRTSDYTSLAVTNKDGDAICQWPLYPMCTIFTAEALAIELAVEYAKKNKGKYIICSDCKSCITAIKSPSNTNKIISFIRNSLIAAPNKIKVMWIPGHVGILGNERADTAAKNVTKSPALTLNRLTKSDLHNAIKNERLKLDLTDWVIQGHHYCKLNPKSVTPSYPASLPANILKPYIRLRLEHTIFTHSHLLTRGNPSC